MAEENRLPEKGKPGIYGGQVTVLSQTRRGLPLVLYQKGSKICLDQTLELRNDPNLESAVNIEDLMAELGLGFGIIEDDDEFPNPHDEFSID